jgi:hypothetical protein
MTSPQKDDLQDEVGQSLLWLLMFTPMEDDTEKRKDMVRGLAAKFREWKRKADLYDIEHKEASDGLEEIR